jgi:hypothetical protein
LNEELLDERDFQVIEDPFTENGLDLKGFISILFGRAVNSLPQAQKDILCDYKTLLEGGPQPELEQECLQQSIELITTDWV